MIHEATKKHSQVNGFLRTVSASQHRSYRVHLTDDLLGKNLNALSKHLQGRRSLLVTTPTVAELYGLELQEKLKSLSIDVSCLTLDVDEETKSIENVLAICEETQRLQFARQSVLIGMGGGVCTDLVTMAASLIRRGIPYIRIPTTLLGQVDGSIGVLVSYSGDDG